MRCGASFLKGFHDQRLDVFSDPAPIDDTVNARGRRSGSGLGAYSIRFCAVALRSSALPHLRRILAVAFRGAAEFWGLIFFFKKKGKKVYKLHDKTRLRYKFLTHERVLSLE